MSELSVNTDTVIQEYRQADASVRAVLETLFGKQIFQQNDWKDLFREFCKENNLTYASIVADDLPDDEQAYRMLKAIVKHANDGWKPNWNNSNECKYYPWFDLSVPSGFGFSFSVYVYSYSVTGVGSRLVFKDREVCINMAKKYLAIYHKFITE